MRKIIETLIQFFNKNFILGSLFLASLTIIVRYPWYFVTPRFWAEEGSVYFANAYNAETVTLASFFNPYTFGYNNFIADFSAFLAAHFIPLELAPLLTTLIAFTVQLVPVAIIAASKTPLWDNKLKKLILIFSIIFLPGTGEVWLTTISSQYYFSIIIFLILLEDPQTLTRFKQWAFRFLLVLGGLSGLNSTFLAPLFLGRIFINKTRESIIQFLLLAAATLLQLYTVITSMKEVAGVSVRLDGLNMASYVAITFNKSFILPLFGIFSTYTVSRVLDFLNMYSHSLLLATITLAFSSMAVYWWFLARHLQKTHTFYFLGGFILLTGMCYIGMLQPKWANIHVFAANRYSLGSGAIVIIALIASIPFNSDIPLRILVRKYKVLVGLLVISILAGLSSYFHVFAKPDFPVWRMEVKAWKTTPSKHTLLIWPKNWEVKLDR